MEMKAAVSALAALAQENRLQVFRWLVERGPEGAFPGEVVEALGIAPATLSFHLKALQHAGLLRAQRSGRNIAYRVDFEVVQRLIGFLTETCCNGEPARCLPGSVAPAATPVRGACQ
jgi:ArsR family transcriptional regulator, arsenate/arsenite/antimonite-responsive transcriptional repressor